MSVPGHPSLDETSLPGQGPLDHQHLPGFEGVMMVGSFVLDIVEEPGLFRLLVNAALRRSHVWYERPEPTAAHCFRSLQIVFRSVRQVTWFSRNDRFYTDAERRVDRGCIDSFVADPHGRYVVEGDWGGVTIESASPCVLRVDTRSARSLAARRSQLEAWLEGVEKKS